MATTSPSASVCSPSVVLAGGGGPPAAAICRSASSRTNANGIEGADIVGREGEDEQVIPSREDQRGKLVTELEAGWNEPRSKVERRFDHDGEAGALGGEHLEQGANARRVGDGETLEVEMGVPAFERPGD